METNGSVDTRTMNDRDLGEIELRLTRQLREVHEEMRRRQGICTDVTTDDAYALASHYYEQLMRHALPPHRMGAVRSYFAWMIDKEVERQAKAAAHEELRMSAENRLQQLRSAEVSE